MRKSLLSIALVALSASSALADVQTLTFTGENDIYGLTRQTSKKADDLTLVRELSFSDEGINVAITDTNEEGRGFALVNAGLNEDGIYIYGDVFTSSTNTAPSITLTVPGGKVTGVKLFMSGYALNTLSVLMKSSTDEEATEVESESEGGSVYSWRWSNPEGGETLTMSWGKTYGVRYIRSIEVTYTPDLGGKLESGLAFSEHSVEVVLGEDFTAPVFSNPNNLPITWTSSDEKVATVDAQGKVTPVGKGNAIITAATEGNATYGPGNAKYDLTVIPVANSLVQMKEEAPDYENRVKVECPLTVTFANGNFAFVIDAEGNAGCVEDQRNAGSTSTSSMGTIYKVGDILAAGWIATDDNLYYETIWKGLPQKSEETAEVTYPRVSEISPEDAFRVLTLTNVTFETKTPMEETKGNGTTADGTSVEFQNTYGAPQMAPGKYDVTGVVRYSKKGDYTFFYMSPISYEESKESGINGFGAEEGVARYFNLQGVEVANPENGIYLKELNGKITKEIVK